MKKWYETWKNLMATKISPLTPLKQYKIDKIYWNRKEGSLIWSIMEMIHFFVQIKLNKFAYLYSKPFGNHTLKIMKKYPEIYF